MAAIGESGYRAPERALRATEFDGKSFALGNLGNQTGHRIPAPDNAIYIHSQVLLDEGLSLPALNSMEAFSSSPSSDSNPTASSGSAGSGSGASKYLANLPSRGLFSSTVLSSNPGGMRVYICEHETSPPDDQQIKTNQVNILIRSLTLKKQKGDSSSKDVKGVAVAEGSRKRAAERVADGRNSAKRANSQSSANQEVSSSRTANKDYHGLTVERLRALLKERGLSPKGKKDELIARLRSVNG